VKLRLLLAAFILVPAIAGAQVIQDTVGVCTDSNGFITLMTSAWGTAPCVPPTPYDLFGKPPAGWGSTPACTTGGSFDCTGGDTYSQFTSGYGVGFAQSSAVLVLNNTTLTNVPGLLLNAFAVDPLSSTARTPITITVDGGIQVNSSVNGQYGIVDIFLYRDSPGVGSVQLAQRRAFAVDTAVVQQGVSQFSFTVVDRPAAGGPYSYRVAAQWLAGTASGTVVGGSASVTPHLRATMTASQSLP